MDIICIVLSLSTVAFACWPSITHETSTITPQSTNKYDETTSNFWWGSDEDDDSTTKGLATNGIYDEESTTEILNTERTTTSSTTITSTSSLTEKVLFEAKLDFETELPASWRVTNFEKVLDDSDHNFILVASNHTEESKLDLEFETDMDGNKLSLDFDIKMSGYTNNTNDSILNPDLSIDLSFFNGASQEVEDETRESNSPTEIYYLYQLSLMGSFDIDLWRSQSIVLEKVLRQGKYQFAVRATRGTNNGNIALDNITIRVQGLSPTTENNATSSIKDQSSSTFTITATTSVPENSDGDYVGASSEPKESSSTTTEEDITEDYSTTTPFWSNDLSTSEISSTESSSIDNPDSRAHFFAV